MVKLHVKKGDESQFLYETTTEVSISDILADLTAIYNGRLKVHRICNEVEQLSKYGACLPLDMQGLTNVQIKEQHLVDQWSSKLTDDDFVESRDPDGIRNGKAPSSKMSKVLIRVIAEAKSTVSNQSVAADTCLTVAAIQDVLDTLRGTMNIAYPMGLPVYDPIRREMESYEDHEETKDPEVIQLKAAKLWWAGKELDENKKLKDYIGSNEKTRMIIKLQKMEHGPPSREPAITEEERRQLMLRAHKRQEELNRLEEDQDDHYLDSKWADQQGLKRAFHGVENIGWKPR